MERMRVLNADYYLSTTFQAWCTGAELGSARGGAKERNALMTLC